MSEVSRINAEHGKVHVIVIGTDPSSNRGGIATVMPGYFSALDSAGFSWTFIPTHHALRPVGKWYLFIKSIPKLTFLILRSKRRGAIPVVYSHPGPAVSLLRHVILLTLSKMLGARTLIQVHAPKVDEYLGHWAKKRLLILALKCADMVAVLTPWWEKRLRDTRAHDTVSIIPNPIPPTVREIALSNMRDHSGPVVGERFSLVCMTRLVEGKGVDLAINTMAHLPSDSRLIVAGDGAMRRRLEIQVEEQGLQGRVTFSGWANQEAKTRLLENADVFFLPSQMDSFGMGFIEAMAHGLPIVALRWGPIEDVVPHDRAGLLVDDADAKSLAQAILNLHDPSLRQRMGQFGRKWILSQFSQEQVAETIRAAIEQLVPP